MIRGIPGQGKSFLAKKIISDFTRNFAENKSFGNVVSSIHLEADMFFIDRDGNYKYNSKNIKQAHQWCRNSFENAIKVETDLIVVSNTFTQKWEFLEYIKVAKAAGYEIEVMIPDTPWANDPQQCFERNTHGVPLETIKRMMAKMEPFSPEELEQSS